MYSMHSSKLDWKQFELAADTWQWLDEQGFKPVGTDHLSFEHADGTEAMLYLPEGENADKPTNIRIDRWQTKHGE